MVPVVGVAVGAVIEIISVTVDVVHARKMLKQGAITDRQYQDAVGKRVTMAAGDIGGGAAGAAIGAVIGGPIGAIEGGFIGTVVGNVVGWGAGQAGVKVRDAIN